MRGGKRSGLSKEKGGSLLFSSEGSERGKVVGFLLELVRIVVLMVLIGAALSALMRQIYVYLGFDAVNGWLLGVAIYLVLFVMYRNKWQFSGWYKGKGREKLPRRFTIGLILCSVILAVTAPFVK